MGISLDARELVQALIAAGLTQDQIAERTGVTQATVSKVLNGRVDDVMSKNYRRLLALYEELAEGANAKAAVLSGGAGPVPCGVSNAA